MSAPFIQYVEAGFSVIPIREDGSKAPALGAWREFQERRPTIDEARVWAETGSGIAILGGKVSGNLEVIDLDEPSLVRPFIDALKAADPGLLDKLALVRTPRRNESGQAGCHVYYRCEVEVGGSLKLAMSEPEPAFDGDGKPEINPATGEQVKRPRTLIETKAEGGYVLTVGCSPKCHPTGNLYEHVYGRPLADLETITEAERATLRATARTFDRSVAETHTDPKLRGYERAGRGESPGDAFNERATWAEIIEPHGWQCVGESGGIKRWRRPGKASGLSATSGLLSKAGNELLVVFSTNAHPFEGVNQTGRLGVSYSKFAAYALLNHQGDFEAAAKALLKLGYGTPAPKGERPARVLKTTLAECELRYLDALERGDFHTLSLGIPALDEALGGGVEPGEMIVLGGLPSHGKSVCALQATRAIVQAGQHAVYISNEMGAHQIAKRLIASRTGYVSRDWWQHTEELRRESEYWWSECGVAFLLEQCRDIGAIQKEVGRIAAEYDLGLVVVDHAQLTDGKGTTRYEQMTHVSGCFKAMAVEHDCVCLVLSQLSREAARQGGGESHHLKESGAFEQDADVIILVQWPYKADPEAHAADPRGYIFKITKNRNRPICKHLIHASFRPASQTIEVVPEGPERYAEFEPWGDSETEDSDRGF